MIDTSYCQLMARYNAWMNDRIYSTCAALPDDERKADRKLFFGSVHSTLNHLLYGDIAWLSRFIGEDDNIPPLGQDLHESFDDLRLARVDWDSRMLNWAHEVNAEWLASPFTFKSKVDGRERTQPAWVLVTHMFNHGTHHRGQLTAALSQAGFDYGSTDIPFMPDQEK